MFYVSNIKSDSFMPSLLTVKANSLSLIFNFLFGMPKEFFNSISQRANNKAISNKDLPMDVALLAVKYMFKVINESTRVFIVKFEHI